MSRAPAHAGRLRPWERFVFALVFALMAGFVVTITLSSARPPQHPPLAGPTAPTGSRTVAAGVTGPPRLRFYGGGGVQSADRSAVSSHPSVRPPSARLGRLLADALGQVLSAHPSELAVGVIDETTGRQAVYHGAEHFRSAGVVTADILAALLVQHQRTGSLSSAQADLATAMMDNGSDAAATSLWRAAGGRTGMAAANYLLHLRQTIPGSRDHWGQTRTTAADQLQLLTDLTSARSPLAGPSRDYVLGLMAGDETGQRWGVSAAATPATGYAVRAGWLPDRQLWVVDSIGVVLRHGQLLLIAVLSSHSPTEAAGISLVSAAAVAAADLITRAGS